MDDTLPNQSHEPVTNLSQNIDALFLWDVRMLINKFFKVAIAYFLNDVVIMTTFHDIQNLNNIFRLDQLQDLYLRKQGRLQILILVN